jgi:adenylate cyclase
MTQEVRRTGGRVLKQIGDGIMAVFNRADAAVHAAAAIQRALDEQERAPDQPALHVRVGLSSGPAVVTEGDLFGDVVNVAARLEGHAGPGEIVLSGTTYEELAENLRQMAQRLDEVVLRGRPARVPVYRFQWKPEDATAIARGGLRSQAGTLHLQYENRDFVVSAERPKLRAGRAADVDIVVANDVVSRYHAEISMRGDKFFLRDSSANGTYVWAEGAAPVRVAREDFLLVTAGDIRLGAEEMTPIHYEVRRQG